jgi:hypothetical protein
MALHPSSGVIWLSLLSTTRQHPRQHLQVASLDLISALLYHYDNLARDSRAGGDCHSTRQ